jgi:hypothetical protein
MSRLRILTFALIIYGSEMDFCAAGLVTYTFGGHVYRQNTKVGAIPEDISLKLDKLFPATGDRQLNISPNGKWMVMRAERLDTECAGWDCLLVMNADLSSVAVIKKPDGGVIHAEGFSAISSSGNVVLYSAPGGPHDLDLWKIRRGVTGQWGKPVLLTAASPHTANVHPAISRDGSKVLFDCGPQASDPVDGALCEVGTNGTGFRVVLTPEDAPPGFQIAGGLHSPDFTPDGSVVFEANWSKDGSNDERIWRLPAGGGVAKLVNGKFHNDNSPCVLSGGYIVSLWLGRLNNTTGAHEPKLMKPDGLDSRMLLKNKDVDDIGLGCGAEPL